MDRRNILQFLAGVFSTLGWKVGQQTSPAFSHSPSPIVGAWHLLAEGAPILHHSIAFHADGIVCSYQADGGYPQDSESDGAGAWKAAGKNQVQGGFVEFRHDRQTHAYLGYVRVQFEITVNGDTFRGNAVSRIYDDQENLLAEVRPTWSATRIPVS